MWLFTFKRPLLMLIPSLSILARTTPFVFKSIVSLAGNSILVLLSPLCSIALSIEIFDDIKFPLELILPEAVKWEILDYLHLYYLKLLYFVLKHIHQLVILLKGFDLLLE